MSASCTHVAIVGAGFAGTCALWHLVDRYPVRQITVFEASGAFGPGVPYREDDSPHYLINNTTDTMCLASGHRRAFLDWLAAIGHPGAADPQGHLPRAEFGRFLREVFRAAVASAAIKGIAVRLVPQAVTEIDETLPGRVRLTWAGGETLADAVLLATGRCAAAPRVAAPPPGAHACLIPDHLRTPVLDALPPEATVHVLGTSLSAYDVVNRLFAPETGAVFVRDATGTLQFEAGSSARQVVLMSRSGRLKKVGSATAPAIRRTRLRAAVLAAQAQAQGGLTLADLQALVEAEAAAHGVRLDWAALAHPYRDCTNAEAVNQRAGALLAADLAAARQGGAANFLVELAADAQRLLWHVFAAGLLQPEAQRRYRREVETALLCYAAPCPIPTAERLLALHRAGRLRVCRGVGTPVLEPDGRAWTVPHAHGAARATVLVDASGALDRRLDSPGQPPLYAQAARSGLLRPHAPGGEPAEGIAVDLQTGRAAGTRAVYLAGMMLWGPAFFTSSAFLTARMVERALAAMFGVPLPLDPGDPA